MSAAKSLLVVGSCLSLFACGTEAGDPPSADARVPDCGSLLRAVGGRCTPALDECTGDDEVPLPGGGCKHVGVRICEVGGQSGVAAPPDYECLRVGVAECTAATGGPGLRGPPDWTACKAIGAPMPCIAGWAVGKRGFCEPPSEQQPCGSASMAVVGKRTCQPVGECGHGRWGNVLTGTETIYVDAAAIGPELGTADSPFHSIAAGLRATPRTARGHVVIAAGRYEESLRIDRPVRIEGRCAAQVTIAGIEASTAALTIDARDVTLRGVTVTSPEVGVLVEGRATAVLESVVVRDCEDRGIQGKPLATITVRDSLLAANRYAGIDVQGVKLVLERSMVRDSRVRSRDAHFGFGVGGFNSPIAIRECVIARNRGAGVVAIGNGKLDIVGTLIHGTTPRSDGLGGQGVSTASAATLTDVSLLDNTGYGVWTFGASVRLERVLVTARPHPGGGAAYGILSTVYPAGRMPTTTLRDVLVVDAALTGVLSIGDLDAERVAVRRIRGVDVADVRGVGFAISVGNKDMPATARVRLRDVSLLDSNLVGLFTLNAVVTMTRSLVARTRVGPDVENPGGWAIQTLGSETEDRYELDLRDSLLQYNTTGIVADNARVRIRRVAVSSRPTAIHNRGVEVRDRAWLPVFYPRAPALVLEDSLVEGNNIGVHVLPAKAVVRRCVVRGGKAVVDERASDGLFIASGIVANHFNGHASDVSVSQTVVNDFEGVGVLSRGSSLALFGSRVFDIHLAGGRYGNGVAADSLTAGSSPVVVPGRLDLDLVDIARVEVGIVYDDSSGWIRRSRVRHSRVPLFLDNAKPTVGRFNLFSDNDDDRISYGRALPLPASLSLPAR
ncbi:MAG: right-handed parallel beta-helix repeat-containing protein [Myxococcales bacterium]|nr:right-handed parallel beta-helix repeat-containing protein [Myxococcales bacterium]